MAEPAIDHELKCCPPGSNTECLYVFFNEQPRLLNAFALTHTTSVVYFSVFFDL